MSRSRQVGSTTLADDTKILIEPSMRVVCNVHLYEMVSFVNTDGSPTIGQVYVDDALPIDVLLLTKDGEVMVFFV